MVKISILSGGIETVLLETKKQAKPHAEPIALVQRASLQTLLAERLRRDSPAPKNGVPLYHLPLPVVTDPPAVISSQASTPTVLSDPSRPEPPRVSPVVLQKQPLSQATPVSDKPVAPEFSTVVPQKSLPLPLPNVDFTKPPPLQYTSQVPVPSPEPHRQLRSHAQFHPPKPLEETESLMNDGDDNIDVSVTASHERPAKEFDPVRENPRLVEKYGEDFVLKMFSRRDTSSKPAAQPIMPDVMSALPNVPQKMRSVPQPLPPPRSVDRIEEEEQGRTHYVKFDLSLPIWKEFPRTMAKPGSETKALVCAWRYAKGFPLWHPDDWNDHGAPKHLRDGGKLLSQSDLKDELRRENAYLDAYLQREPSDEEDFEDVLEDDEFDEEEADDE